MGEMAFGLLRPCWPPTCQRLSEIDRDESSSGLVVGWNAEADPRGQERNQEKRDARRHFLDHF